MKSKRSVQQGLALLCCLLLAAPACAASLMQHGAYAEAEARNSAGAHAHNADPRDGRIRWGGASAYAGTTASARTPMGADVLAANSEVQVAADLGRVNMLVLTTQTGSLLGSWASSSVLAAGYFRFETLVLGTPGSSGRAIIDGSFAASVAQATGLMPSEAQFNFGAAAESFAPGSACRSAICRDDDTLGFHLQDGESLLGSLNQPFSLDIAVKAGDTLRLVFTVGARVSGGYVLAIGADPDTVSTSRTAAAAAAAGPSNGFGAIQLSEGLSLAPVEGLAMRDDGSYGFTSPVPEPSSLLLLGVGLLVLLRRWHHGKR